MLVLTDTQEFTEVQIYFGFIKSVRFRGNGWGADVLLGLTPHRERVRRFVGQEERTLGNVRGGGLEVSQQSVCGNRKQRPHVSDIMMTLV